MLVQSFQVPVSKSSTDARLTERESEILRLLAPGYHSKEVADELRISVTTVNTHVRNVYEKLHVRSRAEAVAHLMGKRP